MRLDCPNCGTALEFSRVAPRFCSHCGSSLLGAVQTLPPSGGTAEATTIPGRQEQDPDATHSYPPPRCLAGTYPDKVGRYRLMRMLGGGGMGTVFAAEETTTGRLVAVKLIRPEYTDSPDAVERFRREGRLASTLFHPRCVFVLAADEDDGQPYIVMELMPGHNLQDLVLTRGPLPVSEAVEKILDVIEGLQEAHRLGVVHRDVKPSNCFLDEEGRVKVGDFGLAKSLVGREQLTRSGSFLGTVLFASPEQIRNEPVDPRTDVYSVCATLYYLLTGRAPFQDDDPAAALARAVSDPPTSMRKYRPEIPRTLDEVVLRGLSRSLRTRWQSLEELRLALLPFLEATATLPDLGWRVTAFLLDLLVLLPLQLGLMQLVQWLFPASQVNSWLVLSPLVGLVTGLLYFGLPEWYFGCSLGKFATRLRVRNVLTRDRPSLPRSLWRTFLFYLGIDVAQILVSMALLALGSTLGSLLITELDLSIALRVIGSVMLLAVLPFVSAAIGVGLLAVTMRRANGYRGVHELLSGTQVIRLPSERPRFRTSAKTGWPSEAHLPEGVPTQVSSYDVLAVARRTDDEMLLQGEDRALRRPVWLWLRRGGERLSATRRDLARDARPRWLADGEQDGWRWDAFVAAAGCTLADLVPKRRRLGWRDALSLLEQLAIELEEAEQDHSLPDRLSPEQIWVQPSGRVLLLDTPAQEPTWARTPMNLLRQTAAIALEGHARPSGELDRPIRAPIPWHASELMGRLLGASGAREPFTSLNQVRQALSKGHEQPEEISRPARGMQVVLTTLGLLPGLICQFLLSPVLLLAGYTICVLGAANGEFAKKQVVDCLDSSEPVNLVELQLSDEQQKQLNEIQASLQALQRDREAVQASWSWFFRNAFERNEEFISRSYTESLIEELKQDPSADQGLDAFLRDDDFLQGPSHLFVEWQKEPTLPLVLFAWPVIWAIWAFLTRGGLAPWLAGIALVGADGRPAARWRCAWRALVVWLPVALLLYAAMSLDLWRVSEARSGWSSEEIRFVGWISWHLWWAAVVLLGVYVFIAMVWPNRGPHDRLSGVYPVPR